MHAYEVFKHPSQGYKAVKRGFSWPGFFFSWVWALTRGLWLVAGGLILVSIALVFVSALIASNASAVPSIILGLVLGLIVGTKANSWRCNNLEVRGYSRLGLINARDPADAITKVGASGDRVPQELKASISRIGFFSMPPWLQGVSAIIWLTWKAAFRYRLFWVLTSLLLMAVVGLPLLIKDDGTAAGFAQILITYTLTAVTGLLGLCTLWISCGTLARDVEECQIQMVAVKPIARWQIWIGKWLGLVTLDAVLLAIAGLSVYGLLEYRAQKLPEAERFKLQNEVLVARASVKEPNPEPLIQKDTDRYLKERLEKGQPADLNIKTLRAQIEAQVRAGYQVVPPGQIRGWVIPLGAAKDHLKDQPLYVRMKFNSAQTSQGGTLMAAWLIGLPKKTALWQDVMSVAPDTFYEFKIDPNLFDEKGNLYIAFRNVNDTAVLFTPDEGMEVLYRQGSFALNFVRGLGIILSWMALLSALGLAAASFLSFPVAAFFSLAVLVLSFSSGTLSNVVSDGTIMGYDSEKGIAGASAIDGIAVPTFKGLLEVINLVQAFSPIDSLSTGRLITMETLGFAFAQIVLLMGGILALGGIFIFSRRELATAQGTQ